MSDQFCRNDDSLRLSDDEIPLDSLPSSVSILHDKHGNTIFFVGTAHVSNQSVDDVQEAIERVRPALVAIELCHHRTGVLHAEGTQIMEEQKSLPWYQLLANSIRASKSSSSGFFHFFMSRMLLTVSAQLKVSPGAEFRRAFECAKKLGAKVVLVDRAITTTVNRAWHALSVWQKVKFVFRLLRESLSTITEQDIERLKNSDLLSEMLEQLSVEYGSLKQILVDERDAYMSQKILQRSESLASYNAHMKEKQAAALEELENLERREQELLIEQLFRSQLQQELAVADKSASDNQCATHLQLEPHHNLSTQEQNNEQHQQLTPSLTATVDLKVQTEQADIQQEEQVNIANEPVLPAVEVTTLTSSNQQQRNEFLQTKRKLQTLLDWKENKKIVVVAGYGHLAGMKHFLLHEEEIDLDKICQSPTFNSRRFIVKILVILVVFVAILVKLVGFVWGKL